MNDDALDNTYRQFCARCGTDMAIESVMKALHEINGKCYYGREHKVKTYKLVPIEKEG